MRRTTQLIAVMLVALTAATTASHAQVSGGGVPSDSLRTALSFFSLSQEGVEINGRLVRGSATVAKDDTTRGPFVTVGGTAEVFGVVTGDVYALWGDVIIHDGAEVHGGASAYRGRVILDGGRVQGRLEAWPAAAIAVGEADAGAIPMTRGRALQLSAGWTAMFVVVGVLVLVLLSANIEATARTLESEFGRSFFVGVLGQIGFLPALLIVCIGLAVTLVGILLVPFALVAAPIALIGFLTLGWLALALVTGRALMRSAREGSSRAEALRALTIGVVLLMAPWILAAALQGSGEAALVARVIALAVTWVATTAGFGAAILSRAGATPRKRDPRSEPVLQGWQTPTPVAGVAAARRPIPARPGATPT